ncbi:hypothetical protein TNCV_5066771 [Trichonephila clavipes]|nr:hypothetical protein TNCV_5066771 [Trichonephila clavipes]
MVFTKQNKHPFGGGLLVDDASSDLALPSSIFQCIGFIGQRHGHHSGRKVLGEGINRVHDELKVFKAALAFVRFKQDAIQQGLQKEAVVSLNASVTVPTLMNDPRHHGGAVKL